MFTDVYLLEFSAVIHWLRNPSLRKHFPGWKLCHRTGEGTKTGRVSSAVVNFIVTKQT